MSKNITFRMAEALDATFIHQCLQSMVMEQNLQERFNLSKQDLSDALFGDKKIAEVILVLANNQPVGLVMFSMTNRNFDLFNGPGIYVHDLYITTPFRGRKVATQLTEQLRKVAVDRDCDRIDWVVLKNNHQSIRFCKNIFDAKEVDYINYMRIKIEK